MPKMIDCAQIRLETLRLHVKQNKASKLNNNTVYQLKTITKHQPQEHYQHSALPSSPPVSVPEEEDCHPVQAQFFAQERCSILQLANPSRPIEMSRFTVIPVHDLDSECHQAQLLTNNENINNSLSSLDHNAHNKHALHVRVPEPKKLKNGLAVSPSDSVDSGVPTSPLGLGSCDEDTLSPLPGAAAFFNHQPLQQQKHETAFHFQATSHQQPEFQPKFRARSASECLDFRQCSPAPQLGAVSTLSTASSNGGSTCSLSPNGTPLRSILKKPKVVPPGMGNTRLAGVQNLPFRRVPTRFVLSRSVSECHDDRSNEHSAALGALNGIYIEEEEEVVSMEDLTLNSSGNNSPLSVCAEVAEEDEEDDERAGDEDSSDEPQKPTAEQQRKKRVSFNEEVQARVFRSSSSIMASRNKQERRLRQRQRRRTESEGMNSEDEALLQPWLSTNNNNKGFSGLFGGSKPAQDEVETMISLKKRRDSGYSNEFDSGLESEEPCSYGDARETEKSSPRSSPSRIKRHISADSAIGDEDLESGTLD